MQKLTIDNITRAVVFIYRVGFMAFFAIVGAFIMTGRMDNPFTFNQVTGLLLLCFAILWLRLLVIEPKAKKETVKDAETQND